MPKSNSPRLRRLQRRAEELLVEGQRDRQLMALLEMIATEAEDSSEPALFAHRQLAELRLEESPWCAALHLRRLIQANVEDDGVFALLGLCHALMGNFRSAVVAYQRALQIAPNNPWYHHNLGHLLDVGLGRPERALRHLRSACLVEPKEDEVIASLAHCLARLGDLAEAETLAQQACKRAPLNEEHQGLLLWIRAGAKSVAGESPCRTLVRDGGTDARQGNEKAAAAEAAQGQHLVELVTHLLRSNMPHAGFTERDIDGGCQMWLDYASASADLNLTKPAVLAAAIEYAFSKMIGVSTSQAAVAKRYGVAATSLGCRFREVSATLEIKARG